MSHFMSRPTSLDYRRNTVDRGDVLVFCLVVGPILAIVLALVFVAVPAEKKAAAELVRTEAVNRGVNDPQVTSDKHGNPCSRYTFHVKGTKNGKPYTATACTDNDDVMFDVAND